MPTDPPILDYAGPIKKPNNILRSLARIALLLLACLLVFMGRVVFELEDFVRDVRYTIGVVLISCGVFTAFAAYKLKNKENSN